MASGAAVTSYTLSIMLHITVGHPDMVSRAPLCFAIAHVFFWFLQLPCFLFSKLSPHGSPLIFGGFSISAFSKLSHFPHFPLFWHSSFSQTCFCFCFLFWLLNFFSSLVFLMAEFS